MVSFLETLLQEKHHFITSMQLLMDYFNCENYTFFALQVQIDAFTHNFQSIKIYLQLI